MIIRVSGVAETNNQNWGNQNQDQHQKIKFYTPEETKEKVKKDFNIQLDEEMEKLNVDIVL